MMYHMLRSTVVCLLLLTLTFVKAQEITLSNPIKTPSKLIDFEILGKNDNGIFVHYYSNAKNEVEVFNQNLRSVIKREIEIRDRNTRIESILLRDNGGVVFYSNNKKDIQYLEARVFAGNLSLSNKSIVLDSLLKNNNVGFEPYYIKQSPQRNYFLVFNIYDQKNKFSVKYSVYNKDLEYVDGGVFENFQEKIVLKSFKVSDEGVVYAVMARRAKKAEMNDYVYDEIYTFAYDIQTKRGVQQTSEYNGYMFKDFATEIDSKSDKVFITASYINTHNKDDIGFVIMTSQANSSEQSQFRYPFTPKEMSSMNSFITKNWKEQALIIKPKRIIPQSNGGCLVILESQYKVTKVVRDMPSMYSYPYMTNNNFSSRVYSEDNYFDITAVSMDHQGNVNWNIVLPKKQITEGDGGLYSSFFLFESNHLLKFLFNEDIYSSGNFVEYNVNPAGRSKRISILNSEKEQFIPIPQRGVQISGTEIIIPSEQKRSLQLLLLKY